MTFMTFEEFYATLNIDDSNPTLKQIAQKTWKYRDAEVNALKGALRLSETIVADLAEASKLLLKDLNTPK
jgi:hypothetical protein